MRWLTWYTTRNLLKLPITLLYVALMTCRASSSLSRLCDDLLGLLRLRVIVSLSWLTFTLDEVRVVVHQIFDVAVVRCLVIYALVGAFIEADLDLLQLLQALRAVHVAELLLIRKGLHCSQLTLGLGGHLLALGAWLAAATASTFLALQKST